MTQTDMLLELLIDFSKRAMDESNAAYHRYRRIKNQFSSILSERTYKIGRVERTLDNRKD